MIVWQTAARQYRQVREVPVGGVVRGAMAVSADGSIAKPADAAKALQSGAASVGFQIDRDQIPGVITDLKHGLLSLQQAHQTADLRCGNIVAPGPDPHSQDAAQRLGAELVSKYQDANKAEQRKIEAMIENLDAAMRQYDAQEDSAAQAFQYGRA